MGWLVLGSLEPRLLLQPLLITGGVNKALMNLSTGGELMCSHVRGDNNAYGDAILVAVYTLVESL